MYCTKCGGNIDDQARFCTSCGADTQAIGEKKDFQRTTATRTGVQIENTSGQGTLANIPPEIRGWNWGAFFLSWIWGIGNSVWIALLCLIPFVNWVMIFVLGAKGNEWAWQNRKWDSIEHFKRIQRTWAWVGLGIFVFGIAIWIIYIILIIIAAASDPYY